MHSNKYFNQVRPLFYSVFVLPHFTGCHPSDYNGGMWWDLHELPIVLRHILMSPYWNTVMSKNYISVMSRAVAENPKPQLYQVKICQTRDCLTLPVICPEINRQHENTCLRDTYIHITYNYYILRKQVEEKRKYNLLIWLLLTPVITNEDWIIVIDRSITLAHICFFNETLNLYSV